MPKPLMCPTELLQKDLGGQHVIVTGANSGIGFLTAKQLAQQGAKVILACRRVQEGQTRAAEIRVENPHANIEVHELDLASLESVRAFAKNYIQNHKILDLLINNAGVMNTPEGKTIDNFETQFGVNHLGHFLLTEQLLPLARKKRTRPHRQPFQLLPR